MSRRSLRDERGGILVMAAVMIPVFLLLTALVVDVGNWFTHSRQLQNRADAGAFAAGVEYAKNWKACVQSGNAALKLTTAQEIADAARQYAGNPEAADYAGGALPTLRNIEIANQANLDVMINSTNYTDDNDLTDGGVGNVADPCFLHPGDDVSSGGHWTDVKVKERDLPSLFGSVGLPLANNYARARIEIRPALSGHRFLPLAIPNNVITRVQVRYYDECRDPTHTSPLATKDLAPIPAANPDTYASLGGGVLWGLPVTDGDLSVGDPNRAFNLDIPAYDPADCGSRSYLPVGVEVRLASRDEVNLNGTCQSLIDAKFADCFTRLSQIRVWDDGNPASHPLIKDVHLSGGCAAARTDAYFQPYGGSQPRGSRTCNYGATVDVDFGSRFPSSTNFRVRVNGVDLDAPGPNPNGVWTTAGTPLVASTYTSGGKEFGDNNVRVEVEWRPPTGGAQTYAEDAHRAYVGTSETAGAVELVRTGSAPFAGDLPGPALDNVRDGGGPSTTIWPTVGTRSVLRAGILTTLRTEDSQGSQLVACDPAVPSGQEFDLFQFGCTPWFGANPFTNGPWWNTATRECPDWGLWYGSGTMPAPYGRNSASNPWRCVLQAPGSSVGQTGDWMAVATGNCLNIHNNSCGSIKPPATANCGNYDGKTGQPNGWVQNGGDSADPRVISLFIIPYQALKSVSGSKAEIPLLGFASFYVMNWKGQNGSEDDPCPDPDFAGVPVGLTDKGTVLGVFVETVEYEPGPVDPNATCVEGQLTPCRVTLVR